MNIELISEITVDGIDMADYPRFCDAFIDGALYDGKQMTDKQVDEINENSEFVHKCVTENLF